MNTLSRILVISLKDLQAFVSLTCTLPGIPLPLAHHVYVNGYILIGVITIRATWMVSLLASRKRRRPLFVFMISVVFLFCDR